MKKILYILFTALILSSCESELELESPSELTAAGFWSTEEGAITAHTGMFANLRSSAGLLWRMGEMRSDLWGGRTYESAADLDLIESNISASNVPFNWFSLYERIHRINDFLINVPNITFIDEANKSHLLGQVHGLRAYYYYTLLKTWGDVPIILEPLTDIDPSTLSRARSSQADVMAQIKADLAASLSSFGTDNSFYNGSKIYWSKAATLALKGDVFIWSGNLLGGGNPDFTEAITALEGIAAFGIQLESSISNLWGVGNEENDEFIFGMDYTRDEASNIYNSLTGRSTEINPQFNDIGDSMIDFVIAGANRYGQHEKTILLLDDNDDDRKEGTFIRLYIDDNGGLGYPTYNEPAYFGSVFNKFLGQVDGSDRIFENDVPVYRYADVLLLIAEAKNLLGEDPSAEINQIRARAFGENYVPATHNYVNSTPTDNANAILNERHKEFIGEGKRWWDLRRAGDNYVFQEVQYVSEAYQLLMPITADMIGRNPLLTQTPGYN